MLFRFLDLMKEKDEPESPLGEFHFDETTGRITCHEGGKELGQIQISFTPSGRAVIVDVGVPKEYQGRGIGTRLTEEAERVARERGATEIGAICPA